MSNYEVQDLWSMLGVTPEEPKKAETKEKKPAAEKKSSKSNTAKKDTYKLPVTIYTGYREPLQLTMETFNGKETVDKQQVLSELEKTYPEFAASIVELEQDSKERSNLYIGFKESSILRKGKVKLSDKSKVVLGNLKVDLTSIMSDTECEVEIEDISKLIAETYPVLGKVGVITNKDIIVPIVNLPKLKDKLKFPVTVLVMERDKFVITKEEYEAYLKGQKSDDEDSEDDSEDEEDTSVIQDALEDLIVKRYPDFSNDHLELQFNKDKKAVIAVMKLHGGTSAVKKVMIPTVGTVISLVFTKIPLDPSMFGGDEEVEESEIVEFLSKDYPEYAPSRTTVVYDEESKLILPLLKGSSKGSTAVVGDEFIDMMEKVSSSNTYTLLHYEGTLNGELRSFRVEATPVSLTAAPTDGEGGGVYEYRFPTIPGRMFDKVHFFFKAFSTIHNTEVMLRLFYNMNTHKYFFELPRQFVNRASVHAEYDNGLQLNRDLIHIADFHSHNCYPAFFSSIDNSDEKGNKLYGVFGPYIEDAETDFLLRAGTGGYFVPVQKESVFGSDRASNEQLVEFCDKFLNEAERNVIIL